MLDGPYVTGTGRMALKLRSRPGSAKLLPNRPTSSDGRYPFGPSAAYFGDRGFMSRSLLSDSLSDARDGTNLAGPCSFMAHTPDSIDESEVINVSHGLPPAYLL
jgi:hypothetical protein